MILKININNWNLDLFPTIIILILVPLTLYFSYWLFFTGVIGAKRMLNSKKWAHTIGKIIKTEILYKKFGGGDSSVSFKFTLLKTYSYTVKNKEYESNQTFASDSLYQKEFKSIDKFPNRYANLKQSANYIEIEKEQKNAVGKPITVYYNPINPQKACLNNTFNKEILLPIFMGLLFGSGLTFLVYYFLKPIFA